MEIKVSGRSGSMSLAADEKIENQVPFLPFFTRPIWKMVGPGKSTDGRDFLSFSPFFLRSFFQTRRWQTQVEKKEALIRSWWTWPCKEMADDRFSSARQHLTYKTVFESEKGRNAFHPFLSCKIYFLDLTRPTVKERKEKRNSKKSNFPALFSCRVPFDRAVDGDVWHTFLYTTIPWSRRTPHHFFFHFSKK